MKADSQFFCKHYRHDDVFGSLQNERREVQTSTPLSISQGGVDGVGPGPQCGRKSQWTSQMQVLILQSVSTLPHVCPVKMPATIIIHTLV